MNPPTPPATPPTPPPFVPMVEEASPMSTTEIPAMVTPPPPKPRMSGGKIFAAVLGLFLLVGGVGAGVILTGQQQDIRNRAATDTTPTPTPTPTSSPSTENQTVTLNPITDTYIQGNSGDENNATSVDLPIGELNNATGAIRRILIKFDLSKIPAGSTIVSATLSLYNKKDYADTAGVFKVYRVKQVWVENQATWNIWKTGSKWATAGAFGATDTEQTDIGSRDMTASESVNTYKDWTLTASAIQEMVDGTFTNNGFLLKADTELNDGYTFGSASDTNKPKLVIVYQTSGGSPPPLSGFQCISVKAYDTNWSVLTDSDLSNLLTGTQIKLCIASSGTPDKAQFKINDTLKPETTSVRPGSTDFCQDYTVLSTDITISVKAKVHYPSQGWFGENI